MSPETHSQLREIDLRECLDDFIKQILFRHPSDLLIEGESIYNVAHVLGESADIAVKVRRKLVRIVEQLGHVELGKIVKRTNRNLLKQTANYVLRFGFDSCVFFENFIFRGREQAIEPPKHRQRQNDLAVLVLLVSGEPLKTMPMRLPPQ